MKIIYVLCSANPYGGASKSFMAMLDGLIEKGVEPLVVLQGEGGLYNDLFKRGVPVVKLKYRLAVYPPWKRSLKNILLFIPRLTYSILSNTIATNKLSQIVKEFKPDAIHTNVSVIDIGYYAAKRNNIPHIYHIREYADLDFNLYYYPYQKSFFRKLSKENSYSICITKDIMRHHALHRHSRSKVIYNGILSCENIVFKEDKKLYFLYAGRFSKEKGTEDLLMAFIDYCVANPNSTYVLKLAGDSNDKKFLYGLKALVLDNGLDEKVEFLGMRKDIHVLMRKARAVIIPSFHEGFGRVAAEAMFNGALVIGRDTAGTKEQFDNGLQLCGHEIGLRYNKREDLVEILSKLYISDKSSDYDMINSSQKCVEEFYSIESHRDHVFSFYKEVIYKNTNI